MNTATDTAADVSDIRLFDPATLIDPYDAYRRLRDHDPVHYLPELGIHVVTRYDLVREAIKDTATFSSRFDRFLQTSRDIAFQAAPPDVQQELVRIGKEMIELPPTMLTLDEPEHTKYRSLVKELFTASQIKKSEPYVRGIIEAAADRLAAQDGRADFMQLFAFPVPLRIISDRLGIPEEDREFFYDAATAAAAGLRLTPVAPDELIRRARLALDLQRLLVRLIEARRSQPTDDMISILANSRLAGDDRHLTHGEALSILNQFLVAGHETTTSTFGWGMLILCRNPGLQQALHDDVSLIRTFVEETLRLEAPVQGLPRLVTRDTELGGYPLKAGEVIMLRYGAANRDERQFENPDQVDLHRQKAGMQLAFGSGVHHCIGAPLARQELNLGFPALLERIENVRLSDDHPPPQAEPSFILRNLPELHIRFERRG
ncbi:MAG TPA: cytochrome P450 [Pseudomonadales bacterium]